MAEHEMLELPVPSQAMVKAGAEVLHGLVPAADLEHLAKKVFEAMAAASDREHWEEAKTYFFPDASNQMP